jgi:hypothetical protein
MATHRVTKSAVARCPWCCWSKLIFGTAKHSRFHRLTVPRLGVSDEGHGLGLVGGVLVHTWGGYRLHAAETAGRHRAHSRGALCDLAQATETAIVGPRYDFRAKTTLVS